MKATRSIVGASLAALTLVACGGGTEATDASGLAQAQGRASFTVAPNIAPPWLGTVNSKTYDGNTDDLLTGGLGKTGLSFASPAPATSTPPTAVELRKLALYNNYRAIVDVNPAGGYGTLYGPNVAADGTVGAGEGKIAGTEYIAYAALGNARENVTLMVQVPASFDPAKPCIVSGTSSGSRGVYGAIGSSGEWGLKRGCAVAYADKGTGMGVHNLQDDTVNLIDGTRTTAALAGDASNFTANVTAQQRQDFNANTPNRIAVKHAHSEQNPEKDWGRDTLRAIEFALYVLNEQYGVPQPSGKKSRVITPENTIVIASSVSNGGGAALQAAEEDKWGLIDGVAVTEPSIQISPRTAPVIQRGNLTSYAGGSKPLYDYFTYASLYQPCAALSTRAAGAPFGAVIVPAFAQNRCASLAAKGLLAATTLAAQADEALNKLLAYGWEPESNVLHPSHYGLATTSITMTYSNTYGRFSVLDNLCGLSFAYTSAGLPVAAPASLATIFGTGNGVPPMGGINIVNNNNAVGGPLQEALSISPSTNLQDYNIDGALCQRELMTGNSPNASRVQLGIQQVQKSANLQGKPAIIVHGRSDTLVPTNFSSRPYYAQNQVVEGASSKLRYIEVTNAQHFDAFLANPVLGYNALYVPLHVYFNRAMDAMYDHLTKSTPLPPSQVVKTTPRGAGAPPITPANVPPISSAPGANAITFNGTTLTIPD